METLKFWESKSNKDRAFFVKYLWKVKVYKFILFQDVISIQDNGIQYNGGVFIIKQSHRNSYWLSALNVIG